MGCGLYLLRHLRKEKRKESDECQKFVQRKWMPESSNLMDKEFLRRFAQSFLDMIVATILLQKEKMTGYSMLNTMKEKFNVVTSAGSLYPILNRMENRKLIRAIATKHGKEWILTSEGKRWYREMALQQKEISGITLSLLEPDI